MGYRQVLLSMAVCACVAGCATAQGAAGRQLLKTGDWAGAERQLHEATNRGDNSAWNDLGIAHERQGATQLAINAYIIGARYGDTSAQQNLVRLGLPVPEADKAAQARAGGEALLGILGSLAEGYNAGTRAAPPDWSLGLGSGGTRFCDATPTTFGPGVVHQYTIRCR